MSPTSFLSSAQAAQPLATTSSVGTPLLWVVTIGAVVALLVVDFLLTRRPHEVSMKEAVGWSSFYVAIPLAIGAWIWQQYGGDRDLEHYTGVVEGALVSLVHLGHGLAVILAFIGVKARPALGPRRVADGPRGAHAALARRHRRHPRPRHDDEPAREAPRRSPGRGQRHEGRRRAPRRDQCQAGVRRTRPARGLNSAAGKPGPSLPASPRPVRRATSRRPPGRRSPLVGCPLGRGGGRRAALRRGALVRGSP